MRTPDLITPKQSVHELIDHYIDQFEIAMNSGKSFVFQDFLPPKDHPDYPEIACELVRIDLEYGFVKNQSKHLSWYENNLPGLFENDHYRKSIAFELDRLSKIYPDHVGPEECTLVELTADSAMGSDYLEYSVMADLSDLTDPLDSESHDPLIGSSD